MGELKLFIYDKLCVDGTLVAVRCRSNWFDCRPDFAQHLESILSLTAFVDNNRRFCSLYKRITMILDGVTGFADCACGSPVSHDPYSLLCKPCIRKKQGQTLKVSNMQKYGNGCACNTKEGIIKSKQTKLERYGDENYINRDKSKQTTLERYGVDHISQRDGFCETVRQTKLERYGDENYNNRAMAKQTTLERYGVDNAAKLVEVQNMVKQTKLERYGDENYVNTDKSKQTKLERYGDENYNNRAKIETTNIDRYGANVPSRANWSQTTVDIMMDSDKLEQFIGDAGTIERAAHKLGVGVRTVRQYINKYDIRHVISEQDTVIHFKEETSVSLFLENIEHLKNSRSIIKPLELDVYIPSKMLAIEMDGVYWHSNKHKHKDYHLNKTKLCEDKDIQLLHIFDCEWNDETKQEIWKSLINNKLGLSRRIFARKCDLRQIQSKERNQFLALNHLQGVDKANHSFGLYHENELVAVMSFIKSRYNKAFKWELSRFCCLNGVSIVGGASRLLTAFRRVSSGDIISYANRRWSEGGLYRALGFEELEPTDPNYFYFKSSDEIHSRQKFQKHKLEKQLEHFDSNLTEWQNMEANGWLKIYDSGNRVFVLT